MNAASWEEWHRLPWHEAVWSRLRPDLGTTHHALLLRGPAGIGKARLARALVAALLCQKPQPDGSACGGCDACDWLVSGNHPDFRRLTSAAQLQHEEGEERESSETDVTSDRKASQQISIEQVRALGQFLALTTHRGGVRVLLVEPAEALTAAAANALLKTLEEPPPSTRFILVSSQPRRLPATILSRCLPVPIDPPSATLALAWLTDRNVRTPQRLLAQAAGRPLHAAALAESSALAERSQFLRCLADPALDPHAVAEKAARETVAAWTEWMQTWCHDLMLVAVGGQPRFHGEQAAELIRLASMLDRGQLLDWELRLRSARWEVRQPVNARLFCDELLMRYRDLFR
jgi:DNA polymerase-3 subunit delta'